MAMQRQTETTENGTSEGQNFAQGELQNNDVSSSKRKEAKEIGDEDKEAKSANEQKQKRMILQSMLCANNIIGPAILIDDLFDNMFDLKTLTDHLSETIDKVVGGDLRCVESLLVGQAKILDAIFKSMVLRMTISKRAPEMQAYSGMALKAQSQARQTLSVLVELKNPRRTMFIKQQNNALNQQVNPVNPSSNTQKTENNLGPSNELLIEAKAHETLDFGRATETSAVNS